MKEEEFVEKYPKERIEIPIYFMLDDNDEVKIDEEEIRDGFENQLQDVLEDCVPIKDKILEELKSK